MPKPPDSSLSVRHRPTQARSMETFELILATAAQLLEELGFEKLNTNIICEHAGLSPPAVYRYFPNKYAILKELGERLMDAQNNVSICWMASYKDEPVGVPQLYQLLFDQFAVTRQFVGAKWVMRSLRSVPELADVRFASHERMNRLFVEWNQARHAGINLDRLIRRVRISNETGYAVFEMMLDGNYNDVEQTLQDTAMILDAF